VIVFPANKVDDLGCHDLPRREIIPWDSQATNIKMVLETGGLNAEEFSRSIHAREVYKGRLVRLTSGRIEK
jgi:hypothetical protein